MKITKIKLEQIIKEEITNTLNEDQEMAMRICVAGGKSKEECEQEVAARFDDLQQKRRRRREIDAMSCEDLKAKYDEAAKKQVGFDATDIARGSGGYEIGAAQKEMDEWSGIAEKKGCPWVKELNQLEEAKLTKSKLVQVIKEEIANTLGELNEVSALNTLALKHQLNQRRRDRRRGKPQSRVAPPKWPGTKPSPYSQARTTNTGATIQTRSAAPKFVAQKQPLTPEEFEDKKEKDVQCVASKAGKEAGDRDGRPWAGANTQTVQARSEAVFKKFLENCPQAKEEDKDEFKKAYHKAFSEQALFNQSWYSGQYREE